MTKFNFENSSDSDKLERTIRSSTEKHSSNYSKITEAITAVIVFLYHNFPQIYQTLTIIINYTDYSRREVIT